MRVYRKAGSITSGVYFNKPDGTQGYTTVAQLQIENCAPGEVINCHGGTTASIRRDDTVPYYGWPHNTFTGCGLILSPKAQGHWFDWDGSIPLSVLAGDDVNPGGEGDNMDPYLVHSRTGFWQFDEATVGHWWLCLVVWASCSAATGNSVLKNQYVHVISQQTLLQVIRTSCAPSS